MLLLPIFLKRFGVKVTLLIGMMAWVVRYVLFAYGNSDDLVLMLILGIALHGICYDFFFVSGQIYTDHRAGHRFKSSAQGMITLATYGIGMLIGFWASGIITDHFVNADASRDWTSIWLFPSVFALAVMLAFIVFFRDEKIE